MPTTERKTCSALDEQLKCSLLAHAIGRQDVDKNMKPLQLGSQEELIGAGVPE